MNPLTFHSYILPSIPLLPHQVPLATEEHRGDGKQGGSVEWELTGGHNCKRNFVLFVKTKNQMKTIKQTNTLMLA